MGLGLTFDVFSQIMCSGPTFLIGWTKGRAISQRKVLHVSRWGRRNSTRPFNMKKRPPQSVKNNRAIKLADPDCPCLNCLSNRHSLIYLPKSLFFGILLDVFLAKELLHAVPMVEADGLATGGFCLWPHSYLE
ncbi:hypothetical protein OUZ56_027832 [Daphnia magna]|uniref:Uncharacterized protein n=1 Tax=Daphnia magna TaxID=35525 RepID=A0ABR0B223_9CRUS|nr:hypothetical protein OUZ56_027832 [Daphnia magna]